MKRVSTKAPQHKVLVSACLLGEPVRYDGQSKLTQDKSLAMLIQTDRVVAFCPEVAGGLPTPREPAEIQPQADNRISVMTASGVDVSEAFIDGAQQTLKLCQHQDVQVAVLTELSPSCGSTQIYDGHFNRQRIDGTGVTSRLLRQHGIRVFNQHQIDHALAFADNLD